MQKHQTCPTDRIWSKEEFERMHALAIFQGREGFASVLLLGRFAGLRIHECFRIDIATTSKVISATLPPPLRWISMAM